MKFSAILALIVFWALSVVSAQTISTAITLRPVTTPVFEPRAVELLEKSASKLAKASSMEAVIRSIRVNSTLMANIRFLRSQDSGYQFIKNWIQNGDTLVSIATPTDCKRYTKDTGIESCPVRRYSNDVLVHAFYPYPEERYLHDSEWDIARLSDPLVRSVKYSGRRYWNHVTYDVVEWIYEQAYTQPEDTVVYTSRMFIGPDGLVRRIVTTNTKGYKIDHQLLKITLNIGLTERDFSWSLLPNDTMVKRPSVKSAKPLPTYLGQEFPGFTGYAQLLDGPKVTVPELLSGYKATVLWFWNTDCKPCITKMPRLEGLYRELKEKGINIVAVDISTADREWERARINKAFNRITMPILFNADKWNKILEQGVGPVILDSTGKVILEGSYEIPEIRNALKDL